MSQIVVIFINYFILISLINNAEPFVPIPKTIEFPLNFSNSSSVQCRKNSELFERNLKNGTLWAYRMWDASAKTSLGLTEGSTYNLGYYDQCVDITEPFTAQYCLATIQLKITINHTIENLFSVQNTPYESVYDKLYNIKDPNKIRRDIIHQGLCVPASCSPKDVEDAFQTFLNNHTNTNIDKYIVKINQNDCQIKEKYLEFTAVDISFCAIIISLIIIVFICTIFDLRYNNLKCTKIIKCFSARENFNELSKVDTKVEALQLLYFVRIYLTYTVTMGHSLLNSLTGPVFNMQIIEQINRSLTYIFITRGDVVIDLFFLLSGLLTTYNYLIQSAKGNMNIIRTIILRYFRLIPTFALITFFYSSIFVKLGTGPVWNQIIGRESEFCQKNWWTNLLLINNYVNAENLCVLQGWYVAVDFQFLLLSIPLNWLIRKNNKLSWTIFTSVLCTSVVVPFLVTYLGEKDPFCFIFYDYFSKIRTMDVFQTMYIPAHTRAGPYILGMIFGHIYYKMKDSKFRFSQWQSFFIINIGCIISTACIFTGIVFYKSDYKYSVLEASLYATFSRPVFAIAMGLVVFATGYGSVPFIIKILNWSPFVPLAKLSFGTYMVHMILQLASVGITRNPNTITFLHWLQNALFELVASNILALALFLLVENPGIKLAKELIPTNFCIQVKKVKSDESIETVLEKI